MSNSSTENIERLIRTIRDNLTDCELYHNSPATKNDQANMENLILRKTMSKELTDKLEITDYKKTIIRTQLKVMFTEYENWIELLIAINESLRKENIELKNQLKKNDGLNS